VPAVTAGRLGQVDLQAERIVLRPKMTDESGLAVYLYLMLHETRIASSLIATIALTAGIAACGSQTNSSQPSAQSSTTVSRQTTTSPASAAPSTTAASTPALTGADLTYTVRALGTVSIGCASTSGFPPLRLMDPATGAMITAPSPPQVPAGTELTGHSCTLTGSPSDLKVFYIWQYRTPSYGLTPEKLTLMAGIAGVHDKTVTQQAELPGNLEGVPQRIYPTTGGPLLHWTVRTKSDIALAAVDSNTLAVRWTKDREMSSMDDSSVAFYDVFEHTVTIRDVASGMDVVLREVSLADWNAVPFDLDSGYLIKQWDPERYGYYSTVAHQFFPDLIDSHTDNVDVNDARLMVRGKHSLKLINISTGATEFELNEDELKALNTDSFTFFGNYFYVANKSDSPVFDIRSRQQVSSGWHVRPIELIGPSWILVDHRPTWNQRCYFSFDDFRCAATQDREKITLQRISDGVYPGPWY
jgi:hypothetical protein